MPISQNKLMPYSDNPSEIEESGTEPRKSRGTTTRKNRPSSRFKGRKFFQKWIMSSRRLKLPGQQHATHLRPNGSTNDPSGLPIKIRPAFCLLTLINIIILAILGFSRTNHVILAIPKKLFHFFEFTIITSLFYSIPDIEDSSKVIWYWNYFNEILTGIVCFFLGGFMSEFIQLFLSWKVFSWGDLLANELGCLAGYQLSRSLHRRYRDKLALSSLYEPLGAGGSNPRDLELSSEQDEDEENSHDRQDASLKALFGADNPELSNVWSDRLEEGHEYFRFEEDED
ncbi:hypothetical protein MJO29_001589 [Puccinia striiformis f. sp. tritici]|nr:hypothetical protein MJO29_001589 [Puccinia striiformis f. sp. tritici]